MIESIAGFEISLAVAVFVYWPFVSSDTTISYKNSHLSGRLNLHYSDKADCSNTIKSFVTG